VFITYLSYPPPFPAVVLFSACPKLKASDMSTDQPEPINIPRYSLSWECKFFALMCPKCHNANAAETD